MEVTRGLTRGAINGDVYAVTFKRVAVAFIKGRGVGQPSDVVAQSTLDLLSRSAIIHEGWRLVALPKIVGALTNALR